MVGPKLIQGVTAQDDLRADGRTVVLWQLPAIFSAQPFFNSCTTCVNRCKTSQTEITEIAPKNRREISNVRATLSLGFQIYIYSEMNREKTSLIIETVCRLLSSNFIHDRKWWREGRHVTEVRYRGEVAIALRQPRIRSLLFAASTVKTCLK